MRLPNNTSQRVRPFGMSKEKINPKKASNPVVKTGVASQWKMTRKVIIRANTKETMKHKIENFPEAFIFLLFSCSGL